MTSEQAVAVVDALDQVNQALSYQAAILLILCGIVVAALVFVLLGVFLK